MIIIVTDLGCCSGVKNALNIVRNTINQNSDKKIFVNHDLVHNKNTLKEYQISDDIKQVNFDILKEKIDKSILIYSAHGHTLEEKKIGEKYFEETIDAICPLLKVSYSKFDKLRADCNTNYLFYGDKNHPETSAIISRYKIFELIDKNSNLESQLTKIKFKNNVEIYSQSTIITVPSEIIKNFIYFSNPKSKITFHSPCKVLEQRVKKILALKNNIDESKSVFIVIGDISSSNANELKKLCEKNFPMSKSFLISNTEQIDEIYIKNLDYYIVSSTSATINVANSIIEKLKEFDN